MISIWIKHGGMSHHRHVFGKWVELVMESFHHGHGISLAIFGRLVNLQRREQLLEKQFSLEDGDHLVALTT